MDTWLYEFTLLLFNDSTQQLRHLPERPFKLCLYHPPVVDDPLGTARTMGRGTLEQNPKTLLRNTSKHNCLKYVRICLQESVPDCILPFAVILVPYPQGPENRDIGTLHNRLECIKCKSKGFLFLLLLLQTSSVAAAIMVATEGKNFGRGENARETTSLAV
jgi:hypothetical protein